MVLVGVAVLGSSVLGFAALTAVGSRARGSRVGVAALAGVCFPFTWVLWYLRDQRPSRRSRR